MIVEAALSSRPRTRARRGGVLMAFAGLLAVAFLGFVALGVWQLQRMAWKHALIARVEARVHAAAVPAPSRAQWRAISEEADSYRRVRLAGRFRPEMETRTQAVTELGAGGWSLMPLETGQGDFVLVNRGFVPTGGIAAAAPDGRVLVEGLIRMPEPAGGFLRSNQPEQGRWYSRDVHAIARAHGLPAEKVAPFFIDAERSASSPAWPRGGMTVVRFRDSHLSYALTWFGMALLTVVAGFLLFASERRLRQDRLPSRIRAGHANQIQPP